MHRHAFLTSVLAATTTLTIGCSSLGPQTEHTDPVVKTDDDHRDREEYLKFRVEDDGDLAIMGVGPTSGPLPRPLAASISHTDDTELRSFTQRFVAPDGSGSSSRLSLYGSFEGGHEPRPSVSLFRDDTATVFEVHRSSELAGEIIFIDFAVTEWSDSARRLITDSITEFVEMGTLEHTHVLDGELAFSFFVGTDTGDGTIETPDSLGELDTDSPRV